MATTAYNLDMHENIWACLDEIGSAIVEAQRANDDETVQSLAIAHKILTRERARFRALLQVGIVGPRAQA